MHFPKVACADFTSQKINLEKDNGEGMANSVDSDQTAPCLLRFFCLNIQGCNGMCRAVVINR